MIVSDTIGKSMERRFQKDPNILTCTSHFLAHPKISPESMSKNDHKTKNVPRWLLFKYDRTYAVGKPVESRFEIWVCHPPPPPPPKKKKIQTNGSGSQNYKGVYLILLSSVLLV